MGHTNKAKNWSLTMEESVLGMVGLATVVMERHGSFTDDDFRHYLENALVGEGKFSNRLGSTLALRVQSSGRIKKRDRPRKTDFGFSGTFGSGFYSLVRELREGILRVDFKAETACLVRFELMILGRSLWLGVALESNFAYEHLRRSLWSDATHWRI